MNEDKDFKAWLYTELIHRLGQSQAKFVDQTMKLMFNKDQIDLPDTWTGGWYKEYTTPYYTTKSLEIKKQEPSRRVINP